ncbi:MAG: DUF1330 domain-containing protein [Deltaproteobacteria bacterium]|nr:DUF1330 domain-containing protein [Deltaproteobacteria bacterium]MBW2415419.1 DUF1330 domain-containing protein [Deltaproteobacteria bacterium]
MPHYLIANLSIQDREEYSKYEAGFMEILTRHGGKLLAVSDEPEVFEGDWPYTRAVIVRFADAAKARAWYESPEYQALAEHRWRASTGSIVGLRGLA